MAKPEITVRMYKRILGDCFLIMARRDGRQENILIDCGVLQGVPGDKALMQEVAKDILEATKDPDGRSVIHLLVVTHEHWDHISGFAHARETFLEAGPLTIERLWLAWTESPEDEQAQALRRKFERSKKGIAAADAFVKELKGDDAELGDLEGLENFVGPVDEALAATKGRLTGRKVMEGLKEKTGHKRVEYLEPGEVLETPGPVRLRTYVLGPPRTPERLFKDLPTKGEDQETYLRKLDMAAEAFALSLHSAASTDPAGRSPFSKPHRGLPAREIGQRLEQLQERDRVPILRYLDTEAYRRIDDDWAGAAGQLALKLDSDTNNTSLVLAFELGETPGEGEVLLFAADAQVGNWLSWHDQSYPAAPEKDRIGVPEGRKVTAEQLLGRTVLYKVGHHASHNATLKDRGLELMTDQRLVAMIPVVQAEASKRKGWHMPFPKLLDRLVKATSGRVIRGDWPLGEGLSDPSPKLPKSFRDRVTAPKRLNPATGEIDEFAVDYRVL